MQLQNQWCSGTVQLQAGAMPLWQRCFKALYSTYLQADSAAEPGQRHMPLKGAAPLKGGMQLLRFDYLRSWLLLLLLPLLLSLQC